MTKTFKSKSAQNPIKKLILSESKEAWSQIKTELKARCFFLINIELLSFDLLAWCFRNSGPQLCPKIWNQNVSSILKKYSNRKVYRVTQKDLMILWGCFEVTGWLKIKKSNSSEKFSLKVNKLFFCDIKHGLTMTSYFLKPKYSIYGIPIHGLQHPGTERPWTTK